MMIQGELLWGTFLQRTGRFSLKADVGGVVEDCFLPNPGRLDELLGPGRDILLRRPPHVKDRKTKLDAVGVLHGGEVVTVDSRIPNLLLKEAFQAGELPGFEGHAYVRSEPAFGSGRFDFLLDPPCLVEVKSCTLVRDGVALFPDAPTARGSRHLEELGRALEEGYRACIVFVVQRGDALSLRPNKETDPAFARGLREATEKGVEALAYTSRYSKGFVELVGRVEVKV